MICISRNAEEELLSIIRGIKAGLNKDHGFALHIRGSVLGQSLFNQLPHLLDKWIGDPQGQILVCEDRDVFVFSPMLTQKFFTRFKEMLNAELGYETTPDNTASAFYDCTIHLPAIEALAKDKYEKKQERQAREEEKRKAAALNAHANAELVATLASRRTKRRDIQILVIEDDPFSRRMISLALKPDFEAAYADSGVAGLREYLAIAPDIVFLDIDLPDISGLDVLKKIKQIDADAHVVMLSGQGHTDNILKAVDHGAKGFVGKPFAADKLHQSVRHCPKGKTL